MIHLISSSWVNTVRGIIAPISVAIVYVTVALKGAGLIEKAECMKHSAQRHPFLVATNGRHSSLTGAALEPKSPPRSMHCEQG